jgi:DNA-binding cell septation regulator SpoVG
MEITDIRIVPVEKKRFVAHVTITLDHSLVVHGLRIVRGETGYAVTMPRVKVDDTYLELVSVVNTRTRRMLEARIIAEYQKIMRRGRPAGRMKH